MSETLLFLVIVFLTVLAFCTVVAGTRVALMARPVSKPLPPGTPEELGDRVRALCAEGRTIQAVKLVRETLPGLGLRQAKELVDRVAAGGDIPPLPGAALPRLPPGLHERVRLSLQAGQTLAAIKMVREELPGTPLKVARDMVVAVAHGAPPAVEPGAGPRPTGPDLATRARALKADGHREQAVLLVREETGMNHDEASAFVDAIDPAGGGERDEPPAEGAGRG